MSALLLAPSHDVATSTSRGWGERLLLSCPEAINDVQPCARSNVDMHLSKNLDLVYIGHGTADRLLIPGPQPDVLIDATNVDSSRAVIAIACKSAKTLGKKAEVDYLGWRKNLIFPTGNAEPLGDATVSSVSGFLNGGTFEQLHESFIENLAVARQVYESQPEVFVRSGSSRLGAMCAIYWMKNIVHESADAGG